MQPGGADVVVARLLGLDEVSGLVASALLAPQGGLVLEALPRPPGHGVAHGAVAGQGIGAALRLPVGVCLGWVGLQEHGDITEFPGGVPHALGAGRVDLLYCNLAFLVGRFV